MASRIATPSLYSGRGRPFYCFDGNAVAGTLRDVFGREMTPNPATCAHCGHTGALGSLLAFVQTRRTVLRCPSCEHVVMRLLETRGATYLDARGAAYLRILPPDD